MIKLSTWGDTEGKWFYDCESDLIGNKLAPMKQTLSDYEQLKRHLLIDRNYDRTIAPPDLSNVMLDFDLGNANFNARKSFLESRGRFRAVNRHIAI